MTENQLPEKAVSRRIVLAGAAAGAAALPLAASPAIAGGRHGGGGHGGGHGRGVQTGAARAAADRWKVFKGRRIGIYTNPTGITPDGRNIVDVMHESGAVEIGGVFGPEHGFRGTAQAGEAEGTFVDPRTGITVYDAYGATAEKLAGMYRESKIDTLVFDIQEVGTRFYTYIWSLYTAMQAAAAVGIGVIVLDRPSPNGGKASGPMMTEPYQSGVGAKNVVQAPGMTMGELARYYQGVLLPKDGVTLKKLDVVEVIGWKRDQLFADTGLLWVMPSPNMPTPETSLLYAGTGMFEGTNLSEGRGTTRPFELIGAPYVDHRWTAELTGRRIPGVLFREAYFTPTFSKHEKTVCGGVQVHITDPGKVDAIRVGVEMLVALKKLYPEFAWRQDSWDTVRPFWIDKLTGSTRLRTQIDSGASAAAVIGAWQSELAAFERSRRPYLLYR